MVAYSFQPRFVDPIRALTKRQTMRNRRKRHARPGETVQLYTGLRTQRCRLIGTATCTRVAAVTLDFVENEIVVGASHIDMADALDWFARADGFADWDDLRGWFADTHDAVAKWSGVLIEWSDFRPATATS
jgi:hypothetical protein